MKAYFRYLHLSLGLLTAAVAAGADQHLTLQQTPPAVKRALESTGESALVKGITRRTVGDRVIYDVEFERKNARNPRLHLTEDGAVINDSPKSNGLDSGGKPSLPLNAAPVAPSHLEVRQSDSPPAAVQLAIRREAAGREVAHIVRETKLGRTVYEIEFRQPGLNPQIVVADDGTVLKEEAHTKGLKQWFKGTQIEDTPKEVQAVIHREAGDRQIVDIDRNLRGPQPVYEVEVRDPQGAFRLDIAADGSVIRDTRRN